ncbi:MAG: sugar ABC transporter substrate-binding protein [Candidatus Gastranaerophilales bacterium]|nr:sugar ABC transporter substrate-binding protein [Candidatus Gastranaerophilales bacterium]
MKFLKILLSITLILILSSCKVNNKDENVKTLEFWTLQLESFRPYLTEVISEYEKLHPDIKIKWVDIPFSEGEKRTLASVMSNNTPDVVNLNPDFSATLATRKALVNIEEYTNQETLNNYLPQTINNLTYNGHVFGIPWYLTTSVTYYNKKLTDKISTHLPQNYLDLKVFAKEAKEKTNIYAIMPTICESGNLLKIFNKYDSINYTDKGLNFNNEKSREILELFKYLYQNDLIPKESVTQTHREALEQFMSGQTAILVSGTNFLNTIKDNAPEVYSNLDIYPQLTGDNKKSDFSMMNLIIPLKAKHPKEAVDFALFLTNKENQLKFSKLAPVFPSQTESLNDKYFSVNSNDLEQKIRYIGAKGLNNSVTPIIIQKNHSLLNEIVDEMTQKVLLNAEDLTKATEKAQKEWEEINSSK